MDSPSYNAEITLAIIRMSLINKKLSWCWESCTMRSGGRKSIGNSLAADRHIVCGGSRCIDRARGRTALPLLSVLRPKIF